MKKYIFYVFCIALAVSSCSTSKQASKTQVTVPTTVKTEPQLPENICGDMEFEAKMGEKDLSVSGDLFMRRDKCIRLILRAPIIGTEVARLEFTPDYVLLMDKWNKQYAKESYASLKMLSNENIDFAQLQALFWDDSNQTSAKKEKAGVGTLTWDYADFQKVETKNFPCKQTLTLKSKSNTGTIELTFSDLNTSSDWDLTTEVSSKYTKVSGDELLKMLK